MGFSLRAAINHDPHQVISKRRHANKNNPFEHTKVYALREESNWEDYPKKTPDNISMEQDSSSSMPGNNSPLMDLSDIVAIFGYI